MPCPKTRVFQFGLILGTGNEPVATMRPSTIISAKPLSSMLSERVAAMCTHLFVGIDHIEFVFNLVSPLSVVNSAFACSSNPNHACLVPTISLLFHNSKMRFGADEVEEV